MDKRLVGKWYKDEMGETINIFDETPLRMKMSFTSSGFYNFEPNCVYEENNELCYEINDEYHRMVYHVHYENGTLKGYYTQFGKTTPVIYNKVSDEPEDGEYKHIPTTIHVPGTELSRFEILKQYAAYGTSEDTLPDCDYQLNGPVPDILTKYAYDSYFVDLSEESDEIAFATLRFVCDHFGHDGSGGLGGNRTIEGLIDFCETHNGKTNCRGLAILLASLLRLKGIKARHITCMPYEEPFDDCHVVVDCLLPSGKRIMFDPTYCLYYTDKNGMYVSLQALRKMLIEETPLFPNKDASYNGEPFHEEYEEYYRDYMTKNTFRFSRGYRFSDGIDEHQIALIPVKYIDKQVKGVPYTVHDDNFWKM